MVNICYEYVRIDLEIIYKYLCIYMTDLNFFNILENIIGSSGFFHVITNLTTCINEKLAYKQSKPV